MGRRGFKIMTWSTVRRKLNNAVVRGLIDKTRTVEVVQFLNPGQNEWSAGFSKTEILLSNLEVPIEVVDST
uniref:DNA-binding protein n=1 Tax=Haemonchus contortus TaxID=6289 RepID=A0A7I4Y0C1_HAECO